jgi:hypothetical protein
MGASRIVRQRLASSLKITKTPYQCQHASQHVVIKEDLKLNIISQKHAQQAVSVFQNFLLKRKKKAAIGFS